MAEILSITVFLNGAEVKRIREEKKLTQLYVSKVVGVTTDTISRWENNRYPTIKRENAQGLAEALEVDVNEILIDDPTAAESVAAAPGLRQRPWPLIIVLSLVFLVSVLSYFFIPREQPSPAISLNVLRKLPNYAAPGGNVPVRVVLTSPAPAGGFILREYFPKGWKLVQSVPPASSLDNVNGVARWIIKAGDARERIVYMLQVDPAEKAQTETFRGEVIVSDDNGQTTVPVEGAGQVTIAPVQWADSNGDHVIDDAEMLQASYTVDEMEGVYIDWGKLEKLWDAGEYRWDAKKEVFLPVK